MKVGIVGPAKRAVVWENHLAGHPTISEVIIAADLEQIVSVDACFILNESNRPDKALKSIKLGFHTFLISKLPTKASAVEKLYFASEEANVRLQFSHWPTLAPASQWMALKIPKPSFIQVIYEVNHAAFLESAASHHSLWIDELAYCLKYINSSIFEIDINSSKLSSQPTATHLMLQFDNGSTASVYVNSASDHDKHTRFVSDSKLQIECEVESQRVRVGKSNESDRLFFERKEFDASLAADQAATKFLKAIQLKKPTAYNGYDLLQLANVLKKIKI